MCLLIGTGFSGERYGPWASFPKVVWDTLSNIYSDERILKSDYNYGFNIFEIYNICLKNTCIKLD